MVIPNPNGDPDHGQFSLHGDNQRINVTFNCANAITDSLLPLGQLYYFWSPGI